jgi:murein DD-endopeptidase MepM/ murein hydrolase activator NlpD
MNNPDSRDPRVSFPFMILSFVVMFYCIVPFSDVEAKSPRITISPKIIHQGDAFIVKVTGVRSAAVPIATIAKNAIQFGRCGEGCFIGIGAVGIDAKTGTYPVRVKSGKKTKKISLTVKKASVQTIALTLPEEKVTLSPADLEIVQEENNRLKELFLAISERHWEGVFRIPTDSEISTLFGTRRIMNGTWTSIHRGVDIKGSEGDEVRASNNGKVVLAEGLFFGGNTIILDHGQEIHTIYMHLSQMNVRSGDSVSKGDVIGLIGSTGRSTGPHLHFGVKIGNISVNPLSFLKLDL